MQTADKRSRGRVRCAANTETFANCFAPFILLNFSNVIVIVLSHWPHDATQVEQQVAAHVASVKGLGHKSLNLLPSPFTLATCVATSLRGA